MPPHNIALRCFGLRRTGHGPNILVVFEYPHEECAMAIKIKRVYEKPERSDGKRILVDRLWPRGVKKDAIDLWLKDVAPSDELRNWFHHEEPKWAVFRSKYRKELAQNKEAVQELKKAMKGKTATLVYGAKDEKHNQAVVLAEYLKSHKALAKPAAKKTKAKKRKKAEKKRT
jgi:uncharacterized protein YeaO (DUF488 family)